MSYDKTKAVFVMDDEVFDGTDWASPAWWRGNDQATSVLTSMVDSWLDDEEGIYTRSGSFGYKPLTKLRDRVRLLMDSNASLRDRIFEADHEHSNTIMDISCQLSNIHVELQNNRKIRKSLADRNEEQRIEIRELRGLLEKYVAFALNTIGGEK